MRSVLRFLLLPLFFVLSLHAQDKPTAAASGWSSLNFLMGTWDAKATGSTGAAETGAYTFRLEMKDHILARHGSVKECKGPETFDCEHNDLLYVYRDGPSQALKAIFFDNEGHVIHYDVSTPSATTVVFLSDASQPGPQFCLSYELKDQVMYGKFQIRMPGKEEWRPYLEWSGGKLK